jgi:peptidoglycan-binding protein ArfA
MPVKRPSLPWLIGLLVIPLLIAAIGYGASDLPKAAGPSPTPSTTSGSPKLSLAAFSMARNGNIITVTGDFPDGSAKAALIKALNGSLAPGVKVVDQIRINPDVDALDFSKAKPVFADSASIADFTLTVNGDTITVGGTAASAGQKNTIDRDAEHIWSNLNIVDNLAVTGAQPPPPPAAAAPRTDLQSAVNATPITFEKNAFNLTAGDEQTLTQVADKLKGCPAAHAAINGYTDDSGNESLNIPLSNSRSQTVAGFLVAHGITGDRLTVTGFGSANPVADNDTASGRAENRRVEIMVS